MRLHQFSPSYTLVYHYKHASFHFQYSIRKSWASTRLVPLLDCPAAPGQGQPHICRVPGGRTARNRSLFLCQEEQEQGQHTPSPGYSVSSHRQRKLTGSSNPLCWYPLMTEHQCRKEKKTKNWSSTASSRADSWENHKEGLRWDQLSVCLWAQWLQMSPVFIFMLPPLYRGRQHAMKWSMLQVQCRKTQRYNINTFGAGFLEFYHIGAGKSLMSIFFNGLHGIHLQLPPVFILRLNL